MDPLIENSGWEYKKNNVLAEMHTYVKYKYYRVT